MWADITAKLPRQGHTELMAGIVQTFIADTTQHAAEGLKSAYLALSDEQRIARPAGKGRSAIDQIAECTIINGGAAEALSDPDSAAGYDMARLESEKTALTADPSALLAAFEASTKQLIDAISSVADDRLGVEIQLPWGQWTYEKLMAHPSWNMTYHEGQVNYISTLL